MPIFFSSSLKKKRCLLLIGGYKDIPYVWNDIQKLFISDKIDFYAPRTFGNGRSFYQISTWKDWVITYLEAIHILQEQYESIDIIGFSTGSVIALYISQFQYKCKINNIFLCAPFILCKPYLSVKIFFSSNIFSYFINRLYAWTLRFHPKSKSKFAGYRDTHHSHYSVNDYCEIFGDIETETTLFDFIKYRPSVIYANNIVILYPNDDDIIGNINEQQQIIFNIFKKPIDLISIPSYLNDSNIDIKYLPQKSGHVMFKEYYPIVLDVYKNIKKYLDE